MTTPNRDLGVAWQSIELAGEELKELKTQEEDIKTRRAQIKQHFEMIISKAEEALKNEAS